MRTSNSAAPNPLRASWPPTLVRLQPSVERDDAEIEDLDLAKMDENPLIYFLTPTPSSYDDDGEVMDFAMDFDAGIEDAKHHPQVARSVSPSTLGGLSRPPPRPPTPPRPPSTPELEYDMSGTTDDEQYDDMQAASPSRLGLPRRLRDLATGRLRRRRPKPQDAVDTLFPPPTPPPHALHATGRGRAVTLPGPHAGSGPRVKRARVPVSARVSPHAWREPSPDVWAIEEEPGEEVVGEGGDGVGDEGAGKRAVDISAAKPKKRVRFVLPDGSTL
ncbi:hypothetical protein BT67DRAFT_446636 [Trichocladium antarcticum]|uniref:Uncharacterized protein n=1 Tax=Trichocladium antarcticum TaxID=1450529 RepID=A0AAN6UT92_9PEZI|nr:hypothetical protein BT67DRAFT_446636 [Trichocladium antarcticum]